MIKNSIHPEDTKILEASKNIVNIIINNLEIVRTTKYLSPSLIVRGVRRTWGHKPSTRGNIQITLTIGKPNYAEREFIKLCKKAKEPFPVKNTQLKFWKPKKANLKRK